MGEQKFGFWFNNRKNHRVTRKTNRFLLSKLAGLGQPFYYSPHAGWTKLTYANKSLDCSVKAKPLRCQWFRWFRVTLKATCFRCHFCCCEFVFWPPTKRVQMKLWYQFISFCLSHLLIWTNDFISEQLISVHPPWFPLLIQTSNFATWRSIEKKTGVPKSLPGGSWRQLWSSQRSMTWFSKKNRNFLYGGFPVGPEIHQPPWWMKSIKIFHQLPGNEFSKFLQVDGDVVDISSFLSWAKGDSDVCQKGPWCFVLVYLRCFNVSALEWWESATNKAWRFMFFFLETGPLNRLFGSLEWWNVNLS